MSNACELGDKLNEIHNRLAGVSYVVGGERSTNDKRLQYLLEKQDAIIEYLLSGSGLPQIDQSDVPPMPPVHPPKVDSPKDVGFMTMRLDLHEVPSLTKDVPRSGILGHFAKALRLLADCCDNQDFSMTTSRTCSKFKAIGIVPYVNIKDGDIITSVSSMF